MTCNNRCIYFMILSGIPIYENKPPIKIACDYYEQLIKNISYSTRVNCPHYKTIEEVKIKI